MTPPIRKLRIKLHVKIKQARKICRVSPGCSECKEAWKEVYALSSDINRKMKQSPVMMVSVNDLDIIRFF